jgi:hypothetical protein
VRYAAEADVVAAIVTYADSVDGDSGIAYLTVILLCCFVSFGFGDLMG